MKFFTLFKGEEVHVAPEQKIIPGEAFSSLIEAHQIVERVEKEAQDYRKVVAEECEELKKRAEEAGFAEGLKQWAEQIAALENEIVKARKEIQEAVVNLALTAAKKIVGREIETKPDTIADIVANALKAVTHHKRITIYVNRNDYDILEKQRPRLKALFDKLESLTLSVRDDIAPGGCVIETEAGIINAQLENQFVALDEAFHKLLEKNRKEK